MSTRPTENANGEWMTVIEDTGVSQPFHAILGETYAMTAVLMSVCDPSVHSISFSEILLALSNERGSIRVEWDAATLESSKEEDDSMCHKDLVLYKVFVAQAPFTFSNYTISELLYRAEKHDIFHVETDDLDAFIGDLEPGNTYSVMVVAKIDRIYSSQSKSREVAVMGSKNTEMFPDDINATSSTPVTTPWHQTQSRSLAIRQTLASRRRSQESSVPIINEVLFLPNSKSSVFAERRKFIEIYRPNTSFSLAGCVLESDSGAFRVAFDDDVGDAQYFAVKDKATLSQEQVLWKSRGTLWLRQMALQEIDGLALFCNNEFQDFVAWGQSGLGPNGDLYNQAVTENMWTSDEDFVETGTPTGPFQEFAQAFVNQGIKKGNSIGRDSLSVDTNDPGDWSYSGGRNARSPTPGERNFQHSALPVINEVLYIADPRAKEFGKRRKFVEIYREDTSYSLAGCSLINSFGSFRVEMDESFDEIDATYFTIRHKSTSSSDFRLVRSKGLLWMRDFELNRKRDGIALFCDDVMIDYLGWGESFGPLGYLPDAAKAAGMWSSTEDFVETGPQDLGATYMSLGVQPGDSLGRDMNSTDTNGSGDWNIPGGLNARVPTPGKQNVKYSKFPLVNEVLFRPRPNSRDFSKRRVFIEIFRPDTSYSLNGCSLVNNDGTFRVDFGRSFDDVETAYLAVKHRSTLSRPFKLEGRKGIYWLRNMTLDEVDAIALFCDDTLIDYIAWGIDGVGWNGTLHNTAVLEKQWSGYDDYVETEDFVRGHSLGRDADSTDTNSPADWIHQGGSNANGATPQSRNTSPLLLLDSEIQIIDLSIGIESIGDYLEPTDSALASLSVCNTMNDAVSDLKVWLETDVPGLVVPDEPIVVDILAGETCTCIVFPISTLEATPELHPVDVTLVTVDEEEIFSEAQVLVVATKFDIDLETLFGRGLVSVSMESSDGNYKYKIEYDPREIQRFDERSDIPLVPLSEEVTFTPTEAFLGKHPPETANVLSTDWKKKLLFGLANFFALEAVLLRTVLGTLSEGGLEGVLKVLNAKGWKHSFKIVSELLGRYHGMLGINLSLGSSIISAYAADPPEGDFFFVGEENTDPGDKSLTVEEFVEVNFQDVNFSFGGPTRVVGRRIFTRVLADGSKLLYAEDFNVTGDDSITIDASVNQLSYNVGDVVTIEAEAVHGQEGPLAGCHGILTAGIYPEAATAASITILRDTGDGIFRGEIEITKEVACSGGNSIPIFVVAQHTYHELDTGEVPNFSVGFEELRINVNGISPSADVLAFLYDFEPELRPGSVSSLEIEVRNIGQAATEDEFKVEAWMSLNDAIDSSDILIGSHTIDTAFLASESVRVELPFIVPSLDAGDYFILIWSDPEDVIPECNKENNVIASGFTLLERMVTP